MTVARRLRSVSVSILLSVPLVLALAGPALAQEAERDEQIVLTGRVVVAENETVGDVVIFNGPATIDGTVRGDVLVFNGDLSISGTVNGDVACFNGDVTLADGARVGGDLVTQSRPDIASGATVEGDRRRVNVEVALGRIGWISRFAVWVAISVSTLVFGLLLVAFAPRAAEAAAVAAMRGVGRSIIWGLLLFFGIPIVSVIALVTLVGIPFGLGMLLGMALIYSIGYTASSFALGRALVKLPTSPFLAFLAGWGIVRVVSLIPFLGGLVAFVAVVYGLGILAVAARPKAEVAVAAVPAPPPPPPPLG